MHQIMANAINQDADRKTIIRLIAFAALWAVGMAVRFVWREDVNWVKETGVAVVFLVPTVLMFWIAQRLARYRIPWQIELFGMPLVLGALVYAVIVFQNLTR